MNPIENIKALLSKGNLEVAILLLEQNASLFDGAEAELMTILNQFNMVNSFNDAGLYTQEGFRVELSKIVYSILNLAESAHKPAAKPKAPLTFNYMRIFGAYQGVMVLHDLLFNAPQQNWKGRVWTDFIRISDFFQNWEYKDMKPLMTTPYREVFASSPWNKYFFGHRVGFNLLEAAGKDRGNEVLDFFFEVIRNYKEMLKSAPEWEDADLYHIDFYPELYHEFPSFFHDKPDPGIVRDALVECSSNVGFLCFILENTSETEIEEIELEYVQFDHEKPISSQTVSEVLVQEALDKGPIQSQILASIEGKGNYVMMLSCYQKNASGYPEAYYSSVMKLKQLRYKYRGQEFVQEIRAPYKDAAMKVFLPFGWYKQ